MKKSFSFPYKKMLSGRLKLVKLSLLLIVSTYIFALSSCEPVDVIYRDKYLGTWAASEYSEYYDSTLNYDVTISASQEDEDEIYIHNFYMMGDAVYVYAFVDGNFITIPPQEYCDFTVSGSGTYQSNGEIHMDYTTNDGADEDNLTAVLIKK